MKRQHHQQHLARGGNMARGASSALAACGDSDISEIISGGWQAYQQRSGIMAYQRRNNGNNGVSIMKMCIS